MTPGSRVAGLLASLAARDHASMLDDLCELCAGSTASSVALALLTSGDVGWGVVASSDGIAGLMAESQCALGEGPCVDASRERRPVLQPDVLVTGRARWPAFTAEASAAGVRAVFALPLQVGAISVGSLGLYRRAAGGLTDTQLTDALVAADAATLVLLHLQDGRDDLHRLLAQPYGVRAETHQASGMISVQLGVGMPEALLRLRAHAYANDRPVSEVAADVVARRLRFDHSESGHTGDNA